MDLAVASARKAFKPWSTTPIAERRKALRNLADAMVEYKEEFVKLLTVEQGKPLAHSSREFDGSISYIRKFSDMELPEEVLEESDQRKVIQRYTPLGVCCGIVPWNYVRYHSVMHVFRKQYLLRPADPPHLWQSRPSSHYRQYHHHQTITLHAILWVENRRACATLFPTWRRAGSKWRRRSGAYAHCSPGC